MQAKSVTLTACRQNVTFLRQQKRHPGQAQLCRVTNLTTRVCDLYKSVCGSIYQFRDQSQETTLYVVNILLLFTKNWQIGAGWGTVSKEVAGCSGCYLTPKLFNF